MSVVGLGESAPPPSTPARCVARHCAHRMTDDARLRAHCVRCHVTCQVCYPSDTSLRDYLAWRQADCHINNQYNAAFWALVALGASRTDAQRRLAGTVTADKNELLFSEFGINYADLPAMHRKGSVLRRSRAPEVVKTAADGTAVLRERTRVVTEHCDVIGDAFWAAHPELLAG